MADAQGAKTTEVSEVPETDFRHGQRNPFYAGLPAGSRRAVIQSDVAEVFGDSAQVNEALRLLIKLAREQHRHAVEPGMVYGGWLATLDPDVSEVYGSSVNEALRGLIDVARHAVPRAAANELERRRADDGGQ
jgi:hypothetical protein